MSRHHRHPFLLGLIALASVSATAQVDSTDRIKELEQKLDALDQKYRALEQRLSTNSEIIAEKAGQVPLVSIGKDGFNLQSGDGNFKLSIKGVLQIDAREFVNNAGGAQGVDSFLVRRARPILAGTLYKDFDFFFMPDFGGGSSGTAAATIYDAWVNYTLIPEVQLEAGKFKAPLGLERLQTDQYIEFNERGLTANLEPDREIGLKLHGTFGNDTLTYDVALVNGVADAQGSSLETDGGDNGKDIDARVFAQPFKLTKIEALQGLGFGLAGGSGNHYGTGLNALTSGYVTDGQQKFFTYATGAAGAGEQWHLDPQAYYYYGPFWLLGEYAVSDQKLALAKAKIDAQNTAWQIAGGYVLTGEKASYNGVKPAHPFDPLGGGGWGALELVGRYGRLEVDKDVYPAFAAPGSAREAESFTAGLNWYWNNNIRLNVDYSRTTFGGIGGTGAGSANLVTKGNENAVLSRVQLAF